MYLHKETGLCFLAHPRTASRAVRDALKGIGFEAIGAHHDGPENGYDLSSYQVICGVRNHFDALVSWWYNARMHVKEVRPSLGWLAIHMSRNRAYFRPGEMWWFLHSVPGIVWFRYEAMERELNTILEAHGLPRVEIPVVGVSEDRKKRPYQEYYDKNTRHFVEWLYRKEMKKLGYTFEEAG